VSASAHRRRDISGAATDVGRQRHHNEDTYLLRPDLGLYLVADGMGGHDAGDVASAMVRLSVVDFFEVTEHADWAEFWRRDEDQGLPKPAQRLAAAIRKANHDIHSASATHSTGRGMGSTVVAAYHPDGAETMFVAHVGDSRCYRIRGGKLEQLTRDHSLIQEALFLDPGISEEDLARLPANIITRALGVDHDVDVDVRTVHLREGDTYLLCSDGLSGLISSEEIVEAISLVDDVAEVCALLVALANDAGGIDNITALALRT
jgi:protein phosphatase